MPGGRADAHSTHDQGVKHFTVPGVLDDAATWWPDAVMMVIADEPITYVQMRDRSCAAANVLLDLGVQRGDGVALFLGTRPEWVYFWLGCARIGAVVAAVNTANKAQFLAHALRLARARVVVVAPAQYPTLLDVASEVPTLATIALLDTVAETADRVPSGTVAPVDVSTMLERASTATPSAVPTAWDELGALFYTSGTTGPSKAVATTWQYLFSAATAMARAWELTEGETVWTAMPFFHLSAVATVLSPMLVGGTTFVRPVFSPSQVWDDVRACNAVGFAGAGAMVSMLLTLPPDPRESELPLRFISAAPIAADQFDLVERRYRCRVVTVYGLTEAFPVSVKAVTDHCAPGNSGRVGPPFEVQIRDAAGLVVPRGVVGEIVCRTARAHQMSEGYVVESAAGAAEIEVAPHAEWFRTGDLGVIADDELRYVDRLKDAVRRRGENVSSVEVEQVVLAFDAVLEAAVVGVPSELGEDEILAVVTTASGDLDPSALIDHCSSNMPYFCVPRYVRLTAELPKNIVGRVRKDILRAQGIDDAWDRVAAGHELVR